MNIEIANVEKMDKGEICRDYNAAKDKKRQIQILAELNACSKEEIMKILQEGGCIFQGELKKTNKTVGPVEKEIKAKELPQAIKQALFNRLDDIEKEIEAKEKEYKEIADFLKDCKRE